MPGDGCYLVVASIFDNASLKPFGTGLALGGLERSSRPANVAMIAEA
jgi:hypothetical protein